MVESACNLVPRSFSLKVGGAGKEERISQSPGDEVWNRSRVTGEEALVPFRFPWLPLLNFLFFLFLQHRRPKLEESIKY